MISEGNELLYQTIINSEIACKYCMRSVMMEISRNGKCFIFKWWLKINFALFVSVRVRLKIQLPTITEILANNDTQLQL